MSRCVPCLLPPGGYDERFQQHASHYTGPELNSTALEGGEGGPGIAAIAVDPNGYIYLVGSSSATWGNPLRPFSGGVDAFIAKLDSNGALIWNTFLGGEGGDGATAIAVSSSGKIYVAGNTSDLDDYPSWGNPLREYSGNSDAFVAQLDSRGALILNTFLGGEGVDECVAIAIGGSGQVFLAGTSKRSQYSDPAYANPSWGNPLRGFTAGYYEAFAAQLDSSGKLIWNTFLGAGLYGFGLGIAVDNNGMVYLAGSSDATWGNPVRKFTNGDGGYFNSDGFVAQLSNNGALTWNTFLGWNIADAIAVGITARSI